LTSVAVTVIACAAFGSVLVKWNSSRTPDAVHVRCTLARNSHADAGPPVTATAPTATVRTARVLAT
jgi:hypothetical protein